MIARIPLLAVFVASLALAGEAAARGSDRNAVIAGAVVGAVVGGAIVAGSRYDRAPVHVEIGAPPPRVYYESYPRYYHPPPVHYRPYTVVVEPRYQYRSGHKLRHHNRHHYRRHNYRNDRYRQHQRYNRGYYAPRW
ncbi:MAG: hypothetical protein Q8P85_03610 [Pseudomonas sp.]|nr:hypothetical protein [Pseudomonas sp.]